jgi:hypothetical protein
VAVLWRRVNNREIRHAGAATDLGVVAGRMMQTAIDAELERRLTAGEDGTT